MSAESVERTGTTVTIQITVTFDRSLLHFEEHLQDQLNAAGLLATQEALRQFDIDGCPIVIGQTKLTSKGQLPKDYQTPYGVVTVARHVYQSSQGAEPIAHSIATRGSSSVPPPSSPRWSRTSTPSLARLGSSTTWRRTTAGASRAA